METIFADVSIFCAFSTFRFAGKYLLECLWLHKNFGQHKVFLDISKIMLSLFFRNVHC